MTLFRTVSVLALASMAAPAMALDIGGGFSLTGNLEYERLDTGSTDINIALADVDLTYLHSSGFGGFVGVDSFSAGPSTSTETFYGALSYSGDFGRIQIGAPRTVIDDYVVTPEIGAVDFLEITLGQITGSILPLILFSSNETATGVRYDGSFGAASVGLAYHRVEDLDVVSAAVSYDFNQGKLMASVENLSSNSTSGSRFMIGGEYDFGQVTAGALFSSDNGITDAEAIKGYAVYSPTDRLDLTATVLHLSVSSTDATMYGLGVNYDLNEQLYVEAGYLGGDTVFSSQDMFTVGLGVNF